MDETTRGPEQYSRGAIGTQRDEPQLIVPVANFRAEAEESVTKPIIPGMAYEGSGLMIYARQGLGKTRLSLQLAHALMTGDPCWHQ